MKGFNQEEERELEIMAEHLFSAGIKKETAAMISAMVRRPGARLKLIQWMEANPQADGREIIKKAQEIRTESMRKH